MKNLLWILLVLLIVFRYFSTRPVYKNGDVVRITTIVYSDPRVYGNYQTFSAFGLKVYLPSYPEIYYGDKVVLEGVVDNGKLSDPKLISVSSLSGFGAGIRKKIVDFYQGSLPQPMSGLLAGVTLGSKKSLTPDFWQKVKDTGVAHVVVASGTNITFVVAFIFAVAAIYLPRRKSILIVILSIVLYLFISGFEAPLIRAAIMAVIAFWAQSSGRLVSAFRSLILTAGIMLVFKPEWINDVGFILSFVSTASILVFGKRISRLIKFIPKGLNQDFSTTLAAQIGVAPVIFVTFGQFNLLSPLINALILWTVPIIMAIGVLGGSLGLLVPFLGRLILYVCYPLLWWFTEVVELSAKL